MKKILILFIIFFSLASCGQDKKIVEEKKIEIKKEFGDITKFVKVNITDKEKQKLQKILKDRKKMQTKVKKLLQDKNNIGNKEIFEKIVNLRKEYMNKILPFIEKDKQLEFVEFWGKINKAIKFKLQIK